jgi:hypothetical protein
MLKDLMTGLRRNRIGLYLFAIAALLLSGRTQAEAQQFSADLVSTRDNLASTPAGKLRVLDGKVRIETPELADGFFLVDGAKSAAYFVRPAARVFMDARQSSRLTRMFLAVDPDDPCLQWQAMARVAAVSNQGDWHCERLGGERIGERSTAAYRAVSASGQEFSGWIDRQRKFPLRIKMEDGAVITLENVRDEPQLVQLFEIPPGFRKFDPQNLIQRIKQSDVWVAGEKDSDPSHP